MRTVIASLTFVAAGALSLISTAAMAQEPVPVETPEKLSTLSAVVGAPPEEVSARLKTDPTLSSMAEKALDARSSRKRTGTVLAVIGFTIVGVGDLVGAAIIVTAPGYPNLTDEGWNQALIGLGVGVASIGVGLALGIPGVIKVVRASESERQLGDYYQRTRPAAPATPSPPAPAPNPALAPVPQTSFAVPLVSVRF